MMAWLYRARDSYHRTPIGDPAYNKPSLAAAALAVVLGVTACTTPQPAPAPTATASPSPDKSSPAASATSIPSERKKTTTAAQPPAAAPPKRAAAKGTAPLGWGPQQRDQDAAAAAVARMTVSQKAGQVLLPFFSGLNHEAQAATIEQLHLGGSIIMGDNVPIGADGLVNVGAMTAMTRRLGEASRSGGRTWPGMIAVDQEGGMVSRLGAPLTPWPSPMSYGAAGSVPLATEAGKGLAGELAALGFTVDFAPTADMTIGPGDPTIGVRSMSADPKAAGNLSIRFSRGMLSAGVLSSVKHFPGHGSVSVDSHKDMPVQPATVPQLKARDWKPFQAAVAAGTPMIMMGHIAVPALEPGVPASLSKASYAALRGMGFKGVAVTDALNMNAVTARYRGGAAAPAALAAGADLLLMPADVYAAHAAIVDAVASGTLPASRLDEAARRVVTMMVWRARTAPRNHVAPPGSMAGTSAKVSARAVTVLSGPCRGPLVPGSVRLAGGTAADQAHFAAAAREAGITLGSGPLVTLIGYGGAPAGGDIAVALDAPWPLAGSAAPTKVALYGRTPGAFKALLAVLAGKATAPGKLPAAVGPYRQGTGCR
ncbi:MAG: beta-N-acetylhexosaminidase [Arthrobacter sp.]|nr:beta-N-acetylhexosaminidase [Arthrobacter sp.]